MKEIADLTVHLDRVVSHIVSKYTHQLYFTKREPACGGITVNWNSVRFGRQTVRVLESRRRNPRKPHKPAPCVRDKPSGEYSRRYATRDSMSYSTRTHNRGMTQADLSPW